MTEREMSVYKIKTLISCFFEALHHQNILYCVLRNYDELPDNISNDIDLLVSECDVSAFEECLLSAARTQELTLISRPRRYGYRSYRFLVNQSGKVIHFDAWTKITWRGMAWANVDDILAKRRKYLNFYIPQYPDEVCVTLLKDLVQVGTVKDKYKESIRQFARHSRHDMIQSLSWSMKKQTVMDLCSLIARGEWVEIERNVAIIRRSLVAKCALARPVSLVWGAACFAGHYFRMLNSRRSGFFIAFVGPDGSGKSTIAGKVMDNLKEAFPKTLYYHGRFYFLPDLRNIYNVLIARFRQSRGSSENIKSELKEESDKVPKWRLYLYMIYYFWDYFLGYIVIGIVRSKSALLIFDRYFYDYFIQKQFSQGHHKLARLMLTLIPKPDMIIYLKSAAQTIYNRKPELSEAQITFQQTMIEKYLSGMNGFRTVSNEDDEITSLKEITAIIVSELEKRNICAY